MAPRNTDSGLEPVEDLLSPEESEIIRREEKPAVVHQQIVWRNLIWLSLLHVGSIYGLFGLTWKCHWYTLIWAVVLYIWGGLGITAGSHRLWAHRTYQAKFPLRLFLAIGQTSAFQNDIYEWCRDHRVHHKFTETDADPHNASRGFFFSHVGWLLVRKHPDVKAKGAGVDVSDLLRDPIVYIQNRYYVPLMFLWCFIIPTFVPVYYWQETAWNAFFVAGLLRYCLILNATWLVNSVAHIWGMHPYDDHINPTENPFVSSLALGEGWHNYHHVFPSDYRTGEYGWRINMTTIFIDLMAAIGQAYDRKTIPTEIVLKRAKRTGDGSRFN